MSILDATFRTVTCNACNKAVTFEQSQRGVPQDIVEAHPWLKTNRVVLTSDGRNFSYCSDLCMTTGLETGLFNTPEALKVEIPQGSAQAQIQAAAAAAKAREEATAAIKQGQPAKVQLG